MGIFVAVLVSQGLCINPVPVFSFHSHPVSHFHLRSCPVFRFLFPFPIPSVPCLKLEVRFSCLVTVGVSPYAYSIDHPPQCCNAFSVIRLLDSYNAFYSIGHPPQCCNSNQPHLRCDGAGPMQVGAC